MKWQDLETPALILDQKRMQGNMTRMKNHLATLGVGFRPHLKTCKSMEVALLCMESPQGPATVSTLTEADYFMQGGVRDILYAVGMAPNKLEHAARLARKGVRLSVLTDNTTMAAQLAHYARKAGVVFEVFIEIDCDGHRSGLAPDDPVLLDVARTLDAVHTPLAGVLTHAGNAYTCRNTVEISALAAQERDAVLHAAQRLRAAGFACPIVSVGSTPTALMADNLDGVTEVRAGVYMFFDLVMAGLGVCRTEDIALSVLATVIGHQRAKGWIIVDAGWMALSRDRGTAHQAVDQGYGVVCDLEGHPLADAIVMDANQEHGIIASRSGGLLPELPVGAQVRILPNHACATAAAYDAYHVLQNETIDCLWTRCNGWSS